jgi:hypothetical protein
VNTTIGYKCLIFGLIYFHPTTCLDLESSSGAFYEYICLYGIIKMGPFFFTFVSNIVAHLLKARTVQPEKQPLLGKAHTQQ